MKNSVLFVCLFSGLMIVSCNRPATQESEEEATAFVPDTFQPKEGQVYAAPKSDPVSQKDLFLNQSVVVSNDFYNCLLGSDYAGANRLMHPDALSVTSPAQWVEIYAKAQDRTGKLAYVKMVDHAARLQMDGGNGRGDYSELIFEAQYKDGNLREKLTFFRKDSTEKARILGYEYHMIPGRITISEILTK